MNKINKDVLTKNIASQIDGATKKDVRLIIDMVFDEIKTAIANGDKVTIADFGSFEAVERAARDCKNPRTGETVHVESSKAPKFKASKTLKTAVNA